MYTTYTGIPANFDRSVSYDISQPGTGDDITAASEGAEHQRHADAIESVRQHGMFKDLPATVTALHTHSALLTLNGSTGDDQPARSFGGAITARKLQDNFGGSIANCRIYTTNNGEWMQVTNAVWNTSGGNANKWSQDDVTKASWRYRFDFAGQLYKWEYQAAGTAAWVDGAWTVLAYVDANGDFTTTRDFVAQRNLTGVGVKAQRSYSTGSALAGSDFSISTGWGSTATKTVSAGSTDARGEIAIVAQGVGFAANPTITLTFKNGAWPNTPFGYWYIINDSTLLSWGMTTTTTLLTFKGTPVNGTTYTLGWMVSGY